MSSSPCPSPEKILDKDPTAFKHFTRKRASSTLANDASRLSTRSTSFPNIEVLSLHQNPNIEELQLDTDPTNGYHYWTAKSGTLIANMLIAAGINIMLI